MNSWEYPHVESSDWTSQQGLDWAVSLREITTLWPEARFRVLTPPGQNNSQLMSRQTASCELKRRNKVQDAAAVTNDGVVEEFIPVES